MSAVRPLPPFLVAPASAFGRPVCRLGLASYGRNAVTTDDVLHALDRGVNFWNWQGLVEGPNGGDPFTAAVSTLGPARSSVVVCAQFGPETRTTRRKNFARRSRF